MKFNTILILSAALIASKASACIPECWAEDLGFKCCSSGNTEVVYTDTNGDWGVENLDWCGILKVDPNVDCAPTKSEQPAEPEKTPEAKPIETCQFYDCISITSIDEEGNLYSKSEYGECKMNLKNTSCKNRVEYYSKAVLLGYDLCKEKHDSDLFKDENGYWAIENGKWCGVQICPRCEFESIDKYGNIWSTDSINGNKCIVDKSNECNYTLQTTCRSAKIGYSCCKETKKVVARDTYGFWGVENGQWCGINDPFPCSHYTELGYKTCDEIKVNFNKVKYTSEGIFATVNNETCGVCKN